MFSSLSINARRSQWFDALPIDTPLGPGTLHQFHTRRLSRAVTHNRQTEKWDLKAAGSIALVITSPDAVTYPPGADLTASWSMNDAWDSTAAGTVSETPQPAFTYPEADPDQAMFLDALAYEVEVPLGSRNFGSPYGTVTIQWSATISATPVPFVYRDWIRDGITAADSVTHTGLYVFARGSLLFTCAVVGVVTAYPPGFDPATVQITPTSVQIGDDGDPWSITAAGSYTSLHLDLTPTATVSYTPTEAAPYTGTAKALKSHPFTLARTAGSGFTISTFAFKPRTYYGPHGAI